MKKLSDVQKEILREKIISFSEQFVGTPYKYGATLKDAPRYFDCSGFVQYVFKQFGYGIPRSTLLQATYAGKKIKGFSDLKPTDLIFFRSIRGHYNPAYPKGIGHVVMYLGGKKAIHATATIIKDYPKIIERGSVKIESLSAIAKKERGVVVVKRIVY